VGITGASINIEAAGIAKLTVEDILKLEAGESLEVEGESIGLDDMEIRRKPKKESDSFLTGRELSIELDATVDADQIQEGLAREVVRRVQMARKNADFNLDNRIELQLNCEGNLKAAVEVFESYITSETLAEKFSFVATPAGEYKEKFDVDGAQLEVGIQRL